MLQISRFEIRDDDFLASAREAIHNAVEENGYLPMAVWVHPETSTEGAEDVAVVIDGMEHRVPISVRKDLRIGMDLDDNFAILKVNDPTNPLE